MYGIISIAQNYSLVSNNRKVLTSIPDVLFCILSLILPTLSVICYNILNTTSFQTTFLKSLIQMRVVYIIILSIYKKKSLSENIEIAKLHKIIWLRENMHFSLH